MAIIAQLILIGCYSYYSIVSLPSLGVNKNVLMDPRDFNYVFTCSDLNHYVLQLVTLSAHVVPPEGIWTDYAVLFDSKVGFT